MIEMDQAALDHAALRAAIELSREASAAGDEPYGAVLADANGRILARARNTQVTAGDCTAHAELNLLRAASRSLDAADVEQATVYASGEPCPMCAGAIYWAGAGRVVYALDAATMRALSGAAEIDLSCREVLGRGARPVAVIGPLLVDEARAVLEVHYARRR